MEFMIDQEYLRKDCLMGKIRLEEGQFGWDFYIINTETSENILIQTDWEYPGVASLFGWIPCRKCRNTDGTIDCNHKKAHSMIESARNFLDNHIGDEVEDPGYF